MQKSNLSSVQLRDKEVYYVRENGENFVLIRPICEVFDLDADWQIKAISDDEIFGAERCVHTVLLPDETRSMQYVCLPEKLIYGWLMGIKFTNTMSAETKAYLIEYKRECYEVLFNHFHGNLNEANKTLKEKAKLGSEVRKLHKHLMENSEEYRQLMEKEARLKSIGSPYTKHQNKQYKMYFEEYLNEN